MSAYIDLLKLFLMFDVEAVGLQGEGYAVGYTVRSIDGTVHEEGTFACDPERAVGSLEDRGWLDQNVPPITITHLTTKGVRKAFWDVWAKWKAKGCVLVSDCNWPVETNFITACVNDDLEERKWEGPYPLYDLCSILPAYKENPLETRKRLPDELPHHHPLSDARQSARILVSVVNLGYVFNAN